MASWLTYPLQLTGSREFECGTRTREQCDYVTERWHFWYIADYVYALPTVALFMSILGVFIIGGFVSWLLLRYRRIRGTKFWQKLTAIVRYLSYRGFYVNALQWNSAPVGILLLGTVGATYFFCMDLVPQPYYWPSRDLGGSPPLGTRSGWLALACMPFVFATASKTNWITLFTGVSHEKLQVIHRWTAYAFFLLALMHTFPFIVYHIRFHDMVMEVTMMSTLFYWTGIVALFFQAWLTFASHSVMRRMGYEFFKATHFLAVIVFVIVFFWHCDYSLTSWHYFIATAAIYVPCLIYSWLRTAFEYGFTQKAHARIQDNDFIRLAIPSVNMRWVPGQHCFLRFTGFGLHAFSSHPFTICSLPSLSANEKSELVFYIRHSHGMTKKLYEHAQNHPNTPISVLIDGPYGGISMQRFNEGNRLLVVAGGSGAGWMLSILELFCRKCSLVKDTAEAQHPRINPEDNEKQTVNHLYHHSLRVVFAARDIGSRTWFLKAVAGVLAQYSMPPESANISVEVYLTGGAKRDGIITKQGDDTSTASPASDKIEVQTRGRRVAATDNEFSGRPNVPEIVRDEGERTASRRQSLNVYVCGPITMQNDVRNAVARENLEILRGTRSGGVYLHSEHFSWT